MSSVELFSLLFFSHDDAVHLLAHSGASLQHLSPSLPSEAEKNEHHLASLDASKCHVCAARATCCPNRTHCEPSFHALFSRYHFLYSSLLELAALTPSTTRPSRTFLCTSATLLNVLHVHFIFQFFKVFFSSSLSFLCF